MPWKECNIMDERVKFIARFLEGEKVTRLAEEFGISRKSAPILGTLHEMTINFTELYFTPRRVAWSAHWPGIWRRR